MPTCSIKQCSSRKNKYQPTLTFHRFPSNEDSKRKWINVIGTENINSRHTVWYVCSLHFDETCFKRTLGVTSSRLSGEAVPLMALPHRNDPLCDSTSSAMPHENDPLRVSIPCAKVEPRDEICTRCCCCMAEGKHEYDFGTVYVEMFKNCLNMKLGECESAVICSACVGFLREVQQFRETVADTQARLGNVSHDDLFLERTQGRSFLTKDKIKIETEKIDDADVRESCSENSSIESDTEFKTELERNTEYLSDVDTLKDPEFEIKIEADVVEEDNKREEKKEEISKDDSNLIVKKIRREYKRDSKSKIKDSEEGIHRYDENNRVRANIALMLKHSTILPFISVNVVFECFYCDKTYVQFKELKEHTETEHSDATEATILNIVRTLNNLTVAAETSCIRCKLCQRQLETIDNFVEHLKNTHKAEYFDTNKKPSHGILGVDLSAGTFKCHLCDKDFPFFRNLSIHMNEHYGTVICYVCGKKFLSEHSYKNHVTQMHTEKIPCKCKDCGKTFTKQSAMFYHMKQKHLKQPLKCIKCAATFPSNNYQKRRQHMTKVHGMESPMLKCDICGKEYSNSGSLSNHKHLKHKQNPIKELICDICGFLTLHKRTMEGHMDMHNDIKRYQCDICQKRFRKMYTLNLHVRSHLNDRRYSCALCDAAFVQKHSLNSHLKSKHPDFVVD